MFSHHKLKFSCHRMKCRSDKQNDPVDMSWSDISLVLLCCSCQWHNISLCDCNSPDRMQRPPALHQSNSDTDFILTTRTGQYSMFQEQDAFYFLRFFFLSLLSPNKRCRDFIQNAFLIYFCRKIGLFTCKSNVFIKEYEKNLCQGIPEWHSKKCTFYKRHSKTHKYMYESEIVLVIPLVLLSHPTWVTISIKGNNTASLQPFSWTQTSFYIDRQMLRVDIVVSLMNRPTKDFFIWYNYSFSSLSVLIYSAEIIHIAPNRIFPTQLM